MGLFDGKLIVFGLLFVYHLAECTDNEVHKKQLYNCFKDQYEGKCEETRVKIGVQFYECETVVLLDSPPKRIVYKDGETFFSSGSNTYKIINETGAEKIRRTIPPSGEVSDSKGNVYFGEGGMTFVIEKNTGREIKIVTNDYNSYSQYAVDTKSNILFILSFISDTDPLEKTGQLFMLSTDPLNVVDDMIKANIVEILGGQITAMAVDSDKQYLSLGIKEADGAKLIRLSRKKFDPCSKKASNKLAIADVISEMQNKIFHLLDESPEPTYQANLMNRFDGEKDSKSLTRENQRLKRELQLTTDKLKTFSSKLIGFSYKLNRPEGRPPGAGFSIPNSPVFPISIGPAEILGPIKPPAAPRRDATEKTENSNSNSENNTDALHICLRRLDNLQTRVSNLNNREQETQQKFAELLKQFDDVVASDPADTLE